MIITDKIQPVLGFTVKNCIFEKGKQTAVCGLPTERYLVVWGYRYDNGTADWRRSIRLNLRPGRTGTKNLLIIVAKSVSFPIRKSLTNFCICVWLKAYLYVEVAVSLLVIAFVMHEEKLYSVSFPYISCIRKSGFIEWICTIFPAYLRWRNAVSSPH